MRRGLTKVALAEAASVSRAALGRWERGDAVPSDEQLAALATTLRFPLGFFFHPAPDDIATGTASFRALSKMSASERDASLAAGRLAFELADWIEARFTLPAPNIPDLTGIDPETAAASARAYWGLGDSPIPNMVHLLEAVGVRTFTLAEDTLNVDAFSLWRGSVPFVMLNTRKSAEHSRMDAAHELGHLVLHRDHREPRGRDREAEAKHFASAFLIPADDVAGVVPRRPTVDDLVRLKARWQVSVAALLHRSAGLGIVGEWDARHLWIDVSRRGYRLTEPAPIGREGSQIFAQVMEMLRQDGIGWVDVARELNLYPDDLKPLVFGLTTLGIDGGGVQTELGPPRLRVIPGGR